MRETKWLPHSLLDRGGSGKWDRRTSNERHTEMTEVTKADKKDECGDGSFSHIKDLRARIVSILSSPLCNPRHLSFLV